MIQREDMTTLLSELLIYLKHFNEDYISTINYLQKNESPENNLLLLKAYFGANVASLSLAKEKMKLVNQSHNLLFKIFEVDQQQNDILKD